MLDLFQLQLKGAKIQLERQLNELKKMEYTYMEAKVEELDKEWRKIEPEIMQVIDEDLRNENNKSKMEEEDEEESNAKNEEMIASMRTHIEEKNYPEAVKLCRRLSKQIGKGLDVP